MNRRNRWILLVTILLPIGAGVLLTAFQPTHEPLLLERATKVEDILFDNTDISTSTLKQRMRSMLPADPTEQVDRVTANNHLPAVTEKSDPYLAGPAD